MKLESLTNSTAARRAVLTVLLVAVFALVSTPGWASDKPRLVLQITVDALRGDLPTRFPNMLGKGGFATLLEDGIHYTNAHYQHSDTETRFL